MPNIRHPLDPMRALVGVVADLDRDPCSMHHLVCGVREFDLPPEEEFELLDKIIFVALNCGARPMRWGNTGLTGIGILDSSYGTIPEQMVDAIMAEWDASGREIPSIGWLWLGRSKFFIE